MIDLNDFHYHLPEERIAKFPLAERDQSKLLVYKSGTITHSLFRSVVQELPKDSMLVFNNTRVIPARMHFQKESGATIEVFLLEPVSPSTLLLEVMQNRTHCEWICTIGNLKRWTDDLVLTKELDNSTLQVRLLNRKEQRVGFSWKGDLTFAEIVELSGQTPLPPYLKRSPEESDKERYQTVYSHHEGAVAAPTAGLHFTPEILKQLANHNIKQEFVTLHVSAGTFQPIKTENVLNHTMHREQIIVTQASIRNILTHAGTLIPVGTTAMRTLESLYWIGVNILLAKPEPFVITQNTPYEHHASLPTAEDSLKALVSHLETNNEDALIANTSIFIRPGYTFKLCDGLITNFHQPGSTLILLVAAFVGDNWKVIYDEAMRNDYRFLSYGDSSLLWRKK